MKNLCDLFGFLLVFAALASVARASGGPVCPEIDAGTAGSALTLLTGGLFLLKDRVRKS